MIRKAPHGTALHPYNFIQHYSTWTAPTQRPLMMREAITETSCSPRALSASAVGLRRRTWVCCIARPHLPVGAHPPTARRSSTGPTLSHVCAGTDWAHPCHKKSWDSGSLCVRRGCKRRACSAKRRTAATRLSSGLLPRSMASYLQVHGALYVRHDTLPVRHDICADPQALARDRQPDRPVVVPAAARWPRHGRMRPFGMPR